MKICLLFVCSEFPHFQIIIFLQYIHVILSRLFQASNSECRFFTNFFDKGILIFMTLYFHEKISLTLILLIVHSNYISINFIWIFRENAAAMLHISTAFWVTLKYEMQERSRTFCLFLESLLKFRPTFYDQFTFETAIAIVNIPNYKYHHCYYPRSKLYIVSM